MNGEPNLDQITLAAYRGFLLQQNLLPSRRMLQDDIDLHFAHIEAQGVRSVAQLLKALSSREKISAFAKQSGVSAQYLTVLRREAGTLQPKIVPLGDFPDTVAAELALWEAQGIKTSGDCLARRKPGGRLYALCDLTRINGVGPNAAAMFYAAGYRSAADIADADIGTLLNGIRAANADHRYYAGNLGEKDMRFCIDFAKLLQRLNS
ncbi:MAG: helix-hairpin-helix domain-containing protein [Firmicutes bacterium]|nr:helix-hairpin-helix domain-containing protein [Bacillota bacterium]